MTAHLTDWLNLGVRWLHVIAGVVWIGTSFYFVWLNNHVRKEEGAESSAELWAVHGGAFYRVMKYEKPPRLPETLHWFKWEAYTTWLSGFSLLVLVFYIDAPALLTNPNVNLSTGVVAAIGVATLVVGWFVYDALCRTRLIENPTWFAAVSMILLTGAIVGLSALMSSRAAYIHIGALIGTLMAGNVFFIIIPAQREMVQAMDEGRQPDIEIGRHAALRSLHNNYLTLPVLFIMISGHFPFTFGNEAAWAILAVLIVVGAGIRHWFNLRAIGDANAWLLPAAALGMLVLALVTLPQTETGAIDREVNFEEGVAIVQTRCLACHSSSPTQPGFTDPPKGVVFDTPDEMVDLADLIKEQAVDSQVMPLANLTEMTAEERAILAVWVEEFGN